MLNGRKNKSKIICTFVSNCNTFCCGGCNYEHQTVEYYYPVNIWFIGRSGIFSVNKKTCGLKYDPQTNVNKLNGK